MPSLATSPLTTVAALHAADTMLGKDRRWLHTNDTQRGWLERTYRPGVPDLARVPEIISHATGSISNHIEFLRKHGWQAQLTDPLTDGAIATAAVLDVLVEWLAEGQDSDIRIPGGEHFSGFELKHEPHVNPIVINQHLQMVGHHIMLGTKSGDIVHIMETERPPVSVLDLLELVDTMINGKQRAARSCTVVIPKVDLASKQSLDWLPGLHTTDERDLYYVIAQAVQQATLKMNETGARARAADEMRVTRGMTPREDKLIIDKPFLFAITRRNVQLPIIAAYVDYESWKDPGSLER
ncbi:MAG: hypothetical protein NTX72_04080 [Candidatus Uhrbacteria bacterium]|nr:hypothetical protein [Candidatus Uhrbacteria bacterium]